MYSTQYFVLLSLYSDSSCFRYLCCIIAIAASQQQQQFHEGEDNWSEQISVTAGQHGVFTVRGAQRQWELALQSNKLPGKFKHSTKASTLQWSLNYDEFLIYAMPCAVSGLVILLNAAAAVPAVRQACGLWSRYTCMLTQRVARLLTACA